MRFLKNCWLKRSLISEWNERSLYLTIHFLRGSGGGLKWCWHNIRRGGYLIMMLDYKGGRRSQESGKKWLNNKWVLLIMQFVIFINLICIFSTYNFLILCDISAEFYLSFKFIIIKIFMHSNCAITSFKHLWFILKNIWSF